MGGHPKFRFLSSTIWPLLTAGRTQIQYPHWARSWLYAIISWFLAHLQNFLHSISFEKFWKAYANETKSMCVRVRALVISLKVFWWTKTERSFHQTLPFLKLENSVKIRINEYSPLTSLWRETRDECPPIYFGMRSMQHLEPSLSVSGLALPPNSESEKGTSFAWRGTGGASVHFWHCPHLIGHELRQSDGLLGNMTMICSGEAWTD